MLISKSMIFKRFIKMVKDGKIKEHRKIFTKP